MAQVLFGDIRRGYDPELYEGGDFVIEDEDLALDGGLQTAVIISLLTDARAAVYDELPGKSINRRGWWGDSLSADEPIGSKLWLCMREKQTQASMVKIKGYAERALRWMVEDGVCSSVSVAVRNPDLYRCLLDIELVEPDKKTKHKYSLNWIYERQEGN